MKTSEMAEEVGGLADILRHVGIRLAEIHEAYEADADEIEQLKRIKALTARTEIRCAIDNARVGLEPIGASLAKVDVLSVTAGDS